MCSPPYATMKEDLRGVLGSTAGGCAGRLAASWARYSIATLSPPSAERCTRPCKRTRQGGPGMPGLARMGQRSVGRGASAPGKQLMQRSRQHPARSIEASAPDNNSRPALHTKPGICKSVTITWASGSWIGGLRGGELGASAVHLGTLLPASWMESSFLPERPGIWAAQAKVRSRQIMESNVVT